MKTGILLTNIGTPDHPTPSAVRRYLKEFLSDQRVVEIPRSIWLPILYGFILPTRSKKSAALYQSIWTEQGSPLLIFSKKIAEALEKNLQMPVALGMHYGNPSIAKALEELRAKQVDHIVILPLYPQYSATTTAATFDHVAVVLKTERNLPAIQMIRDYADQPEYILCIAESIQTFWQTHERPQHLLFSFHGIPETFVKKGDPYPERCFLTAKLVAKQLKLHSASWSVSFQSRLGRAKWLTPYTEQILKTLPQHNVSHLQVVCPGFATDCLETLEEIAIRGKNQFLAAGGKRFEYIPALNENKTHILLLEKLVTAIHHTLD